jgi:hypothetical protein
VLLGRYLRAPNASTTVSTESIPILATVVAPVSIPGAAPRRRTLFPGASVVDDADVVPVVDAAAAAAVVVVVVVVDRDRPGHLFCAIRRCV